MNNKERMLHMVLDAIMTSQSMRTCIKPLTQKMSLSLLSPGSSNTLMAQ